MKANGYITFEEQPIGLKEGKKLILVQYEFSGIQSFIFGDTDIHSTRVHIRERSEYVVSLTEEMKNWLQDKFGVLSKFKVLSQSSGKLICSFSRWTNIEHVVDASNQLQRMIYVATKGKLEMYYGITIARVTGDKMKVHENNAISELSLSVNKNKFHCTNILGIDMEQDVAHRFVFQESQQINESNILGDGEMWMAIKFDLDNLGSFFQQIKEVDKRKKASEALADVLNQAFSNADDVVPIFIGGDDIFALAKRADYLSAVKKMYENIKNRIYQKPELELYCANFGISGGCSLIRNDLGNVPLLYYFETSEEQLMRAKGVQGKNVLAVEDIVMDWKQLCTIAAVFEKHKDYIEDTLDENQKMMLEINIGALRSRMLNLNKWSKKKIMTSEEERIIYEIG